jgi:hypothetical protein
MTVASHIADRDEFCRRLEPGSFWVGEPDSDGERSFWYVCPCGCGRRAPLTVGENFKPADRPSWNWNGSLEAPTLTPSVHHVGHWHGWLTDGIWKVC